MVIKKSLGIEISGKDLRIAVVRSVMGKLRFIQSVEVAGFEGLSPDEQRTSIAKLIKKYKLPSSRVYLSLPRDRGIVRQLDFPIEVQDKLKPVIALQLETLCPWPVEEIYWDFAREAVRKGAKTITVTVAMIPRAALDPWIDFFKAVKLPLSGASLSSMSCGHGVRALWAGEGATVILNCEPGGVDGTLVSGSRLASIAQSGEDTASAARHVTERLVSAGRLVAPPGMRVVAYGSAAESLESIERIVLPIENAKRDTAERFGAIGAALIGLKKTAFSANLVPLDLRYHQSQIQLIPTYVLFGVAILLSAAMTVRGPYQTMVYASRLDAEIRVVSPQVREVAAQESQLNKLSEKYRTLAGHLQNRDYNLEALRELSRSLPPTAFLTNYSYQDGNVTISGIASSASEVQKTVEDTALFKDVQFTSSVTRDPNGKDRFTMKASIEVPR